MHSSAVATQVKDTNCMTCCPILLHKSSRPSGKSYTSSRLSTVAARTSIISVPCHIVIHPCSAYLRTIYKLTAKNVPCWAGVSEHKPRCEPTVVILSTRNVTKGSMCMLPILTNKSRQSNSSARPVNALCCPSL